MSLEAGLVKKIIASVEAGLMPKLCHTGQKTIDFADGWNRTQANGFVGRVGSLVD